MEGDRPSYQQTAAFSVRRQRMGAASRHRQRIAKKHFLWRDSHSHITHSGSLCLRLLCALTHPT